MGAIGVKARVCRIRLTTVYADRIQSGIKLPQSISHFAVLWLDTALDTSGKRCDVLLPSNIHLLIVSPIGVKARVCIIRRTTAYADRIPRSDNSEHSRIPIAPMYPLGARQKRHTKLSAIVRIPWIAKTSDDVQNVPGDP